MEGGEETIVLHKSARFNFQNGLLLWQELKSWGCVNFPENRTCDWELIVVALLDAASNKLQGSNVFTIAKRTVEGQDMLYQSMKLTNGIWVLAELRVQAGNPNYAVSIF